MWVNPEDGMTWDQICDRIWGHLPSETQAVVTAYCDQTGITRNDYFAELHEGFWERIADPITGEQYRADFKAWLDRERFPVGRDPKRGSQLQD